MRQSLKEPPQTELGPGKGKLYEVGPLIMGSRLTTRKTYGAYSTLIYNKGGLVLRMLHFLMTDPSSGDGKPFFDMMKDFVSRYRDNTASTDDFRRVANEHFAHSPIAARYHIANLDWFFRQWVNQTYLPSYRMEYKVDSAADGKVIVSGSVIQENAPDDWLMPLPVVFKFAGGKSGFGTVIANGPTTPFQIKLPATPESIELDPQRWVLSEKTSTK